MPDQSRTTVLASGVASMADRNFGKSRNAPTLPASVSKPINSVTLIVVTGLMVFSPTSPIWVKQVTLSSGLKRFPIGHDLWREQADNELIHAVREEVANR